MAEENKKINTNTLDEKSTQDLISKTMESDPEDFELEVVEKSETATEPKGDKNLIEFEYESGDGQKPASVKPTDEPKKDEPPKPDVPAQQQTDEEAYKTLVAKVPTLSRFKNLQEIQDHLDSVGQPPPVEHAEDFPLSAEQESQFVAQKTYEILGNDTTAGNLLKSISDLSRKQHEEDDTTPLVNSIPRTPQEWSALYKVDYFLANELRLRANEIGKSVTTKMEEIKKDYMQKDSTNEKAMQTFAGQVESHAKKLYDKIGADDVKGLKQKLLDFGQKAVADNKYYMVKNGVPALNADLLYADFITQNADEFANIARLGALKANGKQVDEMVRNASKGVSQTTMASKNYTGATKKQYNLNSQTDIDKMSEEEIKASLQYLDSLTPTE